MDMSGCAVDRAAVRNTVNTTVKGWMLHMGIIGKTTVTTVGITCWVTDNTARTISSSVACHGVDKWCSVGCTVGSEVGMTVTWSYTVTIIVDNTSCIARHHIIPNTNT